MNDVAAPLYRFFLADAQAAARAGDSVRMMECIALALDFVPESQRERVLLAVAELVPPAAAGGPAAAGRATPSPGEVIVVQIAPVPPQRPLSRITWEDRAAPSHTAAYAQEPAQPVQDRPAAQRPRARPVIVFPVLVALLLGAALVRWGPGRAAVVVLGDPTDRAAAAVAAGEPARALALLDDLGKSAPTDVWLLRAAAHEALADTAAAIHALGVAATRDSDGGAGALQAGDGLARLGAVRAAADAYLYAVTPARTPSEVERIARAQELAGFPDRARRVRQR